MTLDRFFETEKDPDGYNLIDFSQLTLATVMHTYAPTDVLSIDMIRHLIISTIKHNVLKNRAKYKHIVICIDNAEFGYWRRHKAYYYKKHRSIDKEESDWDWDTIHKAINEVSKEISENLPFITLSLPHTEADDIIGVLCRYLDETQPDAPVLITSSDGDFTQLHRYKNVKQWSPMQKKWVQPKHGSPRRDLLYKIVKGDGKDTIANIYSRSDFIITKEEGERQKSVSSKLMAQVFEAKDPKTLFTGDVLARYNENELLLDFDFIPDEIRNPIIEKFNTFKVPPRRLVYPYFVKKKLVKMLEFVNDF